MTIFLTGGAGKTSRRVAQELSRIAPETPILKSSRSAASDDACVARFDWLDASTHENPFKHAVAQQSPVTAVYVVLPVANDPLPAIRTFVDTALQHCSRQQQPHLTLVLLSSGTVEPAADSPAPHGRVHHYLVELQRERPAQVGYTVLRPAFFMENFSEQQHRATITAPEATVFSATGDGGEAFVSAEDIAAVGARCLVRSCELNRDYVFGGPESLTYGDVAQAISKATGKRITHTDLSTEGLIEKYTEKGMPREYATMLVALDEGIRNGLGQKPNGIFEKVTGRKPMTFATFAEGAKAAWT